MHIVPTHRVVAEAITDLLREAARPLIRGEIIPVIVARFPEQPESVRTTASMVLTFAQSNATEARKAKFLSLARDASNVHFAQVSGTGIGRRNPAQFVYDGPTVAAAPVPAPDPIDALIDDMVAALRRFQASRRISHAIAQ